MNCGRRGRSWKRQEPGSGNSGTGVAPEPLSSDPDSVNQGVPHFTASRGSRCPLPAYLRPGIGVLFACDHAIGPADFPASVEGVPPRDGDLHDCIIRGHANQLRHQLPAFDLFRRGRRGRRGQGREIQTLIRPEPPTRRRSAIENAKRAGYGQTQTAGLFHAFPFIHRDEVRLSGAAPAESGHVRRGRDPAVNTKAGRAVSTTRGVALLLRRRRPRPRFLLR
jgi:hypothetical protein